MPLKEPNLLLKPHYLPYLASGLAITLVVAVFALSLSGFLPTSTLAVAPTFSGGSPTDGTTGVAVDATISIISSTALSPASFGTWTSQTSGTANNISEIYCASATTCWATGASGTTLVTTNSGSTWTAKTGGVSDLLSDVVAFSANAAWFVGARAGGVGNGVIQKTTDGGANWTSQSSGVAADLMGIGAIDTDTAYVSGDIGTILKTTNGGTTWTAQTSNTANVLNDISVIDANTAWTAGFSGTIRRTTNGGTTWATVDASGVTTQFNGIYGISSSTAYVVGNGGAIYKTTNGGTSWSSQTSGTTNDLNAIYCVDTNTCWVVGASGTVLYTSDGGTTWYGQASSTTNALWGVHGASASAAWFVGNTGTIHTFGYTNVLLQANTGNTQAGSPSGSNLCTSVTLSNSDKTITCAHANLSKNTWYTSTLTTGVTSNTGDALAANVARAFRANGAPSLSTASITDASFAIAASADIIADFDNPIAASSLLKPTWASRLTSSAFNAVHALDTNHAVAVGANGVTSRTFDGGSTWIGGSAGSTTLNGVTFPTAQVGWTVGNSGTILKTVDLGITWTAQTSGTSQNLKAVHCADAVTCWAVGANGVILKTGNGGTSWSSQTSGTTETLFGLHVADANTVFAAGNSGTVLKTTNGGTTWASSATGATTGNHGDVFCASATACWIASDTGLVYRTTDGGVSWTAATPELNITWNGIHFASSTTGWVVGSGGKIYTSTDGGVNWTSQTSATSVDLTGVSFVSATTGIVVGGTGTILTTANGGTTWTTGSAGVSSTTFNGVDFSLSGDVATGWAVGGSGTIRYAAANNGWTWTPQTSGTSANLQAVEAVSVTVAYVTGASGTILKTTTGGSSWTAQTSGTTESLNGLSCADANTCWAVGGSVSTAVALKTTDGGTTWSALTTGASASLLGTTFVGSSTGWVVGTGGVIRKTTDGGTSWSAQTSGTTNTLERIACSDANTCIVVGLSGTILTTADGGSTWTTRTSGTTNDLIGLSCMDANTCTAVGASGTILKTTDGGANWSSQTSGTTNGLNAVHYLSTGADAIAVGDSSTIIGANRNVALLANTGAGRTGIATGTSLCTRISLGNDGSGNANRRITCSHTALSPGLWYTLVLAGGANGLASTSGTSDVLDADATRIFRTAFGTNHAFDLAATDLSSLASEGYLTINTGTSTAAAQATFAAMMRSRVTTSDGTVLVTVPQNAVFTRAGGGTFDTTAIALSDYTSSATNVPGTKRAVIQYGVPGVSLTSNTAITIAIPVAATVTDSTVLDVYRDADGNFSDATTTLTTCTVSSSTCSFTTTSLSYFAATQPAGSPTQTDTTAPVAPTGLSCTSSDGKITCTWTDPGDTDLATLRILHIDSVSQATTLRGTVSKGVQTSTDSGTDLVVGTTYTVGVQAQDSSGNRSTTPTTTVTVSAAAPAPTDTTPPSAPTHLTATSASSKVTLTWTDPTDTDLKLIRVLLLRGEATSIRSALGKGLQTYTDSGTDLIPGLPVTFALEAEDTAGNKSSRVTTTVPVNSGTAPGSASGGTSPPTTPPTNQPVTNQPPTNEPTTPPKDETPPGALTNVTAAVSDDGKVTLTWKDPADPDLAKVRILLTQGGATTLRDAVAARTQTFIDPAADLAPGTAYPYALEAEDTAGNRSPKTTVTVTIPARPTTPEDTTDTPTILPPEPPPPEPPPDLSALLATAPCALTTFERQYLADAFTRSQGRAPSSGDDLQFLCSLRADPEHPLDPTKAFPKYRNLRAEELALKNFVNFFRRPPSKDTRDRSLPPAVAEKDWWAVKYMAYHLRLAPTARDLNGERTCLRLFLDRDVDLYKDGTKARKSRGAPPRDLFDYDFIRACTYSGVTFVSAAGA